MLARNCCRKSLVQWHVNCGQNDTTERMATKIKMLKLLQEADALAELDRRPPKPALYMMHIRPRNHQPTLPKRKLPFRIDPEDYQDPVPVKIVFLKPEPKS